MYWRWSFLAALALLIGAGCGGSGETRLTISAQHWVAQGWDGLGEREYALEIVRFELRCDPAGGTTPNPEAACDAIEKYREMTDPPEMTGTCAGSEGTPPAISIRGVVAGRRAAFGGRGCDQPPKRATAFRRWFMVLGLREEGNATADDRQSLLGELARSQAFSTRVDRPFTDCCHRAGTCARRKCAFREHLPFEERPTACTCLPWKRMGPGQFGVTVQARVRF